MALTKMKGPGKKLDDESSTRDNTLVTKISREDLNYLFKLDDEIQEYSNQIAAIEITKRELVDRIIILRTKHQEFLEQLYEKHELPKDKKFEINSETGEIILDNK